MNKYKVYFQFNGKKQAMIVDADSSQDAKWVVEDKLIIDAVKLIEGTEPKPTKENLFSGDDASVDFFKGIFKMK